jgi:hypothetical protein
MLFPFLGLFVSLVIWGTFYPVPGFIRPSDDFVRRLSGAFKATACAVQVYHVIEVTWMHVGRGHNDTASHFPGVARWDSEEYICLVNGTEVKASVAIPLGEETVKQPVVDGGNNTELVVAVGNDEGCVVEAEYAGGDLAVFTSPLYPQATAWAFAWWYLAVILCFCVGLVPYGAHTLLDAVERLGRYLEPSPKVVRLLVVDSGSSSYLDFLYSSFTSPDFSGPPLEEEADGVVSIHRMVEEAITRLERQRAVAVSPELEYCIVKSWTVGPGGAVEPLTNPVPATSSVVLGQSSAHQPWQRWALVVHRPEDHNVVYQRVCILLARWRHTVEIAVPVQHCRKTVPVPEDVAAPEGQRKRKNRPGQAQRRRQGKRKEEERERQEGKAPALV